MSSEYGSSLPTPTGKPPTLAGYQGPIKRLWRPYDLPSDTAAAAAHDSSPVQKMITGFRRHKRYGCFEDNNMGRHPLEDCVYWADSSADASTITPDCSADDVAPSHLRRRRDQSVLLQSSSSSVISTTSSTTIS